MKSLKRRSALPSCAFAGALIFANAAFAQSPPVYQFDIPAKELTQALKDFSAASSQQIVFSDEVVGDRNAPALHGAYTCDEALGVLLQGSGLYADVSRGGVIMIRSAKVRAATEENSGATASAEEAKDTGEHTSQPKAPVDKVTVTGSRIRGAKQASPVITITQDEMRRQGHTDLGQAVRALPQSFGGGQNPGVAILGAGAANNQNITGGSSFNLRGLGADATLTLLNGTRLPYDGSTQATDVAVVPVAAIDRLEILLDGASAMYGSDAVGGVANIVLKRDYDGAEFSARWGEATQGGLEQQQFTGVAGTTWATGGFIVTADFNRYTAIKAGQRDFTSNLPSDRPIYGPSKQVGTLFSGHQQLASFVDLTVDAFYTRRRGSQVDDVISRTIAVDRDSIAWGVAPSLRLDLPGDWSLRLIGTIGQNNADFDQIATAPNGSLLTTSFACYCNDTESVSVETEGPLFDLPGGEARGAFGGGYRGNEFANVNRATGALLVAGDDSSHYLYGEVFLPLVSEEQDIPLVHKLSLSGAVRYEEYESFGETTTPKIGAIWGLSPDIDVKASWGKSFKVPTLFQQYIQMRLDLFNPVTFGATTYPVGSGVLFLQGGNPDLTPEKAETFSAGFVAHPKFLSGFRLEANWFDIDYRDRVTTPFNPLQRALVDPMGFEFVVFNPTVVQQNAAFAFVGLPVGTFTQGTPPPPVGPYDPARIVAIVDGRNANTAAQHVQGIDLIASYTFDLLGGSFTANGNATWLETTQKLTQLTPERIISGYVFNSPEFRGRIGGAWSADGLTMSATVNQTDGVTNNLVPGNRKGGAFTTVDLVIDYVFESGPLGGELQFTLGAQNLLDRDPPRLQPANPIFMTYDSTNYPASGRVVNVTVTQRF